MAACPRTTVAARAAGATSSTRVAGSAVTAGLLHLTLRTYEAKTVRVVA